MEPFPLVFKRVLANSDVENRWCDHEVFDSPYDAFKPRYEIDGNTFIAYLPSEYRILPNSLIRSCMEWLIRYAYTGVKKELPGSIFFPFTPISWCFVAVGYFCVSFGVLAWGKKKI